MLQLEPAGQSSVPYFSNDTAPTGNYTLSLHDALPISEAGGPAVAVAENVAGETLVPASEAWTSCCCPGVVPSVQDRKSTRLNSSHQIISYAVFCLKKKSRQAVSRQETVILQIAICKLI